MSDPLSAMRALRNEIEQRLLELEDFRAFRALNRAIAEMETAPRKSSDRWLTAVAHGAGRGRPEREANKVSQAEAAERALRQSGHPLTVNELVPLVQSLGATVSGNDPIMSLSSTLSRDIRFVSIRHYGRQSWWLAGAPTPPEDFTATMLRAAGALGIKGPSEGENS